MMADSDHDAGPAAGIERGLRIGFGEREWLFAINMLAGSRNGFDLRTRCLVCGVARITAWIDLSVRTSSREVSSAI